MYLINQLIASTRQPFSLEGGERTMYVHFAEDSDIDALLDKLSSANDHRAKLSLHLDQLRGNDLLPVIDIYLNLPDEASPAADNYAGSMGLYGLTESSAITATNDGVGQHRIFDVGDLFCKLRHQPGWSHELFRLTLVPARTLAIDAALTIGRVDLYYTEE